MKTGSALLCPAPGMPLVVQPMSRGEPKADEIEVGVEAAAVNPIDARRADGYGRRLLSLMGAGRFPLVLGNDYAGVVTGVGNKAAGFSVGDKVFGVKPASTAGTHASHVVVKASHAILAPTGREPQSLAVLPYSFVTMWLAVTGAGLTRQNASGRAVLVHGAAGGLGMLALQLLSSWGAKATAVAWPTSAEACKEAGAAQVLDCTKGPLPSLGARFDATLNFASWDDDLALLRCLRNDALGHATTVHPLLANFDNLGWVRGGLASLAERRQGKAALPKGAMRYAWTLFRPDARALAELNVGVQKGQFNLVIGSRASLEHAADAFSHVRAGKPGRALLLP